MEYRYRSHTIFQIEYYFVWVTKHRYKVLTEEVTERVRELVREISEAFEIRIMKGVVSKDHVHILASYPSTMAPRGLPLLSAEMGRVLEPRKTIILRRRHDGSFLARSVPYSDGPRSGC